MLAADEAGDVTFGGVLKARRGGKSAAGASQAPGTGDEARTQELLDAYFGTDEQLPEGERFLKSFIRNKVALGPLLSPAYLCRQGVLEDSDPSVKVVCSLPSTLS